MKTLANTVFWSLRIAGLICLGATPVILIASFWKGIYCVALAIISFFLSQVLFATAEESKTVLPS